MGCSIISGSYGATTLIKKSTLNGSGISASAYMAKLENFTMLGEDGNGGDGIVLLAGRCVLREIATFSMGQDGVRVGDDAGTNVNLWKIENLYTKANGQHGLNINSDAVPDANGGTVNNIDSQGNTLDGIYLGNAWVNTIVGGAVQTNGRYGIHFDSNAKWNNVYGLDISESNVTKDAFFASGSVGNMVLSMGLRDLDWTDNGVANITLSRSSTDIGGQLYGLQLLSFDRNNTNYIRNRRVGGYLSFVTNGDAASDANAQLRVTTTGVSLGKGGHVVTLHHTKTATWNPGSLLDGASETVTVATDKATSPGDVVAVGFPIMVGTVIETGNWQISGRAGTNVVYVTITNKTGSTKDLDSGTLRVDVWQH
jgi:hypothetical protein